jgi:HD-like signal output (HDOD) protein
MTGPNPPALETVLEQSVHAIDIPPRPAILDRLREEMGKDEPDFKLLGQLISADVALAAGLIKTANSPFFGMGYRASTLHSALLLLGLDITCSAVAAISLRRAFPNSAHYERFWDASAKIAALSGWLATRLAVADMRSDDAYSFGLFRDCGIVILLRRYADYSQTLVLANQNAETAFTTIESQRHPTDHTVVGCLLAQNWWLPETICQAIRHHHDPFSMVQTQSSLALASGRLIAVSQTAEYLLQTLTGACQTREWSKLGVHCLQTLHLSEDELPGLLQEARVVLTQLD